MNTINRRRRPLYEGKTKQVSEGQEPGTLVFHFKDDAPPYNAEPKNIVNGKGVINNAISSHLMTQLSAIGVPTHFIRRMNMREQLVRELEMFPIEVVVRNIAAGSFAKRYGIDEGTRLPRSIIEYFHKNDALDDPMISEEHMTAFGWAIPPDIDDMVALAVRTNDYLTGLFQGIGLQLVDIKLEFGRFWTNDEELRILVADEISPDHCRLWGADGQKYDRDRFVSGDPQAIEMYQEVARRLGILPDQVQTESAVSDSVITQFTRPYQRR